MKRLIVLALALLPLVSCGSSSPAAPSAPAIAQIAGVWRATAHATTATTTECVGQTIVAIGLPDVSANAQISQTGSALNVTITDNNTGAASAYTGSVGASAVALTLQTCNLCNVIGYTCLSGARRDYQIQAGSINATVSGNTMTGTSAATYNTFVAGTNIAAGTLTVTSNFSATKQ